ncbi:MAG: hypothetical protein IJI25_01630 [Eubacterium sp.]|nr:hypothetical protein [Eubacterium sp.]
MKISAWQRVPPASERRPASERAGREEVVRPAKSGGLKSSPFSMIRNPGRIFWPDVSSIIRQKHQIYGISCEKVDVSSLFKGRKDKIFAFWFWSQGAPSTLVSFRVVLRAITSTITSRAAIKKGALLLPCTLLIF